MGFNHTRIKNTLLQCTFMNISTGFLSGSVWIDLFHNGGKTQMIKLSTTVTDDLRLS